MRHRRWQPPEELRQLRQLSEQNNRNYQEVFQAFPLPLHDNQHTMGAGVSQASACRESTLEESQQNPACGIRTDAAACNSASCGVRHIRIEREFMGLESFYHHGIDLGDGRVAHYTKNPKTEPAKIRITTWADFIRDGVGAVEEVHHSSSYIDFAKVMARIKSLEGRQGYNLALCNCEHFASFCISGNFRSMQVEEVMDGVAAMQRSLSHAATDILFSGEQHSNEAPFMHKKPHWSRMVMVQTLDLLSDGIGTALNAVQDYTRNAALSFDEAGSSSSRDGPAAAAAAAITREVNGQAGSFISCPCSGTASASATRKVIQCPCCGQDAQQHSEDPAMGANETFLAEASPGASWPNPGDAASALYSAACVGAETVMWLTGTGGSSETGGHAVDSSGRSNVYLAAPDDDDNSAAKDAMVIVDSSRQPATNKGCIYPDQGPSDNLTVGR